MELNGETKPGKLTYDIERRVDAIENDPRVRSLKQLEAAIAEVAASEIQRPSPTTPIDSDDKEHRITVLAERAQQGLTLWHPLDVVMLRQPACRRGRPHTQ